MKSSLKMKLYLFAGIFVVFFMLVNTTNAQTRSDAIEAYNTGVQLMNTDINGAIEFFEKCIEICNIVGEEVDDTRLMVESRLPSLYYDAAIALYRERNLEESIEKFEATVEVAEKYNDNNTKQRAERIIPQLYLTIGNNFYREDDFENALVNFEKAIEINPQYTRAHFATGLVYRKLEDPENMMKAMDKAIETGLNENDNETVERASRLTRDYLIIRAAKAKGEENYNESIDFINKSFIYDNEFSESHYLLASIYNQLKRYQDAINSATKALEYESGGNEEKARVYYELGTAQMGAGQNSAACTSFKNASYGNYERAAKYQIEHVLKCN